MNYAEASYFGVEPCHHVGVWQAVKWEAERVRVALARRARAR